MTKAIEYVLGLDCGTKHFGWSVVRVTTVDGVARKIKAIAGGTFANPLNNLTHNVKVEKRRKSKATGKTTVKNGGKQEPPLPIGFALFWDEFTAIMEEYKITYVVAERWQTRGRGGDSTVEGINIMIGAVLSYCLAKGIQYQLITAAIWKNECARLFDKEHLKALYKLAKKNHGREPHAFDAFFMAVYVKAKNMLRPTLSERGLAAINKVQVDHG